MVLLKILFPFSFTAKKSIISLIINVVLHLAVGIAIGFTIGFLAKLPIIGILLRMGGGTIDLYILIGIILSILNYLKIIK